jgi:hypothetical protein
MKALPPLCAKHDLRIKRGDTLSVTLTIRDGVTKDPIDFTGCSYRAQVRLTKDSTTVIADLTVNELDAAAGELEIYYAAEDSAELPSSTTPRAEWDLEVTFPGGRVWTPIEGAVTLEGDVSRP